MSEEQIILFTGGSGLLGDRMRKVAPHWEYPASSSFDVTDYSSMEDYITQSNQRFSTIVHAAAFTSPPRIDKDPVKALETNIIGTANVAKLCICNNYKLIYISTDYVFDGARGNYKENDPLLPVNNYAWSKLAGEAAARLCDNSLVIRTSFGPQPFPYDRAFADQWTSRVSVDSFAASLRRLAETAVTGVLHVGQPRLTVHAYASGLKPARKIGKMSVQDVDFEIPKDTSLDCGKFEQLFSQKK